MPSSPSAEEGVDSDLNASAGVDWDEFRRLSLQPGGFGEHRTEIWPKLLNVSLSGGLSESTTTTTGPVTYTPGHDTAEVEALVIEEKEAIAHRDERQIKLDTERSFVLYPVDDSSDNRELLQNKLHELLLAIFRKRPALNYFQGYHDIVTVLFLTLPPELRLPCVEKLSLHRVRDSMGASLEPVLGLLRILRNLLRLTDEPYAVMLERNSQIPFYALSNVLTLFSHDMPTLPLVQHVFDYLLTRPPIVVVYLAASVVLSWKDQVELLEKEGEEGMMHSLLSGLPELYDFQDVKKEEHEEHDHHLPLFENQYDTAPVADRDPEDDLSAPYSEDMSSPRTSVTAVEVKEEDTIADSPGYQHESLKSSAADPPKVEDEKTPDVVLENSIHQAVSQNEFSSEPIKQEDSMEESFHEEIHPFKKTPPKVSIISLLARADELYTQFPPSHPSLAVSTIMGPNSVVFTWSEAPSRLPPDDEAEAMVTAPELIVHPFIEDDRDESDSEELHEKERRKRRPRKLRRSGRFAGALVRRHTIMAGAVLALGVAIAIYSIRSDTGGSHSHYRREWKKTMRWFGAAVIGATDRLFDVAGLANIPGLI